MRISDDERRAVAARMREIQRDDPHGWLDAKVMNAVTDMLGDGEKIGETVADLIDRPTYRNLGLEEGTNGEGYDFFCSRCGFAADVVDPRYCPCCGAEVVEGE